MVEDLLAIGLLIVVAKVAEGALGRIGVSSLVAYTLAGILLGPATGLIEVHEHIVIFLEMGIFVFFFIVGLEEIDIPGFVATIRRRHFVAAALALIISIMASMLVTSNLLGEEYSLGLEFDKALCLAGILSLSSLGLVAKVLVDEGRLKEPAGIQIFTAVVIAELLVLFVVGFAISEHFFAGEGDAAMDPVHALVVIGQIFIFR